MKITLNGRGEVLPEGVTLAGLIFFKGINPQSVIVEHNNKLVKSEEWDGIVLSESDRLEILRLVGGG